jgi:hypothetical protein
MKLTTLFHSVEVKISLNVSCKFLWCSVCVQGKLCLSVYLTNVYRSQNCWGSLVSKVIISGLHNQCLLPGGDLNS